MSPRKTGMTPQNLKKARQTLLRIDDILDSAYPLPSDLEFSKDPDMKLLQQAVLYHRLQETPELLHGKRTPENDALCQKLTADILQGKDTLVKYILEQKDTGKRIDMLEEITVCGSEKALFEELLDRSSELGSSAASAADAARKREVPQKSVERLRVEGDLLKSSFYRSMLENREATPREFLAKPENLAAAKKLLATELYRQSEAQQLQELEEVYQFESPQTKKGLITQKTAELEKSFSENYEKRVQELENSLQVQLMLQRMLHASDMEELNRNIWDVGDMSPDRSNSLLPEAERRLVPVAVADFVGTLGDSEEDRKLKQALMNLPVMKGEELSENPAPEECYLRASGYNTLLKKLNDEKRLDSEEGKKLGEILSREFASLARVAMNTTSENVQFNFRPDTEIDYFDPKDPEHRPMDALEARDKLLRGEKLEQKTFVGDNFIGTVQDITYDHQTGMFIKGPEKLVTRVLDLSESTQREPQKQLEDLKAIRDVLKKTDPFYAKNSEAFQKTYETLEKVIRAHENLDRNANIRQVGELQQLYSELDANAALYTKGQEDRLKRKDFRGEFRMDALKSLQSITGSKHVEQISSALFTEKAKMNREQELLRPCKRIMDKWKKIADPTDPALCADFKKDFDSLSGRIGELQKRYGELPYFKMGIANDMQDFLKKANAVQGEAAHTNVKLDAIRVYDMNVFAREGSSRQKELFAMSTGLSGQKKEREIPQPERIFAPEARL